MGEIKKVQIRNGFSDRNNIDKLNTIIQTDSFDERTRIQLYNYFAYNIEDDCHYAIDREDFYLDILDKVYCEVIDNYDEYGMSKYVETCKKYIKNTFLRGSYDAVLSLVEYLANKIDADIPALTRRFSYDTNGIGSPVHIQDEVNELFEKECVGYRFVGEKIVAITDKIEIKEIEKCLQRDYECCRVQIKKAIGFLADREQKDYKNCIKESILAVESICKIIVGDEKASLGETIKKLKSNNINIHPALETAFLKLFGYTSDKGGIRHAEGLFVSDVSFEEAKFMLVSCSAFVNYLIAEYGKIKKG